MVICAHCKAYTDDAKPTCDQCGKPLQADSMDQVKVFARDRDVAQLAQDREQAQLVASGIVMANLTDFYFDDGKGKRTLLVELLGLPSDRTVGPAGLIFGAYAYLCEKGYCSLRRVGGRAESGPERIALRQKRPWDGQQSIEGALAEQSARSTTTREATETAVRRLRGFRQTVVQAGSVSMGKATDATERSSLAAIDRAARLTVLPDHDRAQACRAIYQLLFAFTQADPDRAQTLAVETLRMLDLAARQEGA